MDRSSDLEPVAFLDDDATKRGSRLLGLPVVGDRSDLPSASRRYGADSLLVAMPSARPSVLDAIAAVGREMGMQVQVMPPLVASLSDLLVEHARLAPPPETEYAPSGPAPLRRSRSRSTVSIRRRNSSGSCSSRDFIRNTISTGTSGPMLSCSQA